MKKLICLTVAVLFVAVGVFAQESTTSPITAAPKTLSVVGQDKVTFEATRWPDFYKYSSDNAACGERLKNKLSLTRKKNYNGTQYKPILTKKINFKNQGLDQYRKSAKLLITWTVRVEGISEVINVWKAGLCHPWHGTSYQKFPGGDVMTKLYINGSATKPSDGTPFANTAKMTLPDGKAGKSVNISDPTHTGSAVVTPDDFGGEFPEELTIIIKWYNDTCMKAQSPANMRNLVVTITPM